MFSLLQANTLALVKVHGASLTYHDSPGTLHIPFPLFEIPFALQSLISRSNLNLKATLTYIYLIPNMHIPPNTQIINVDKMM